MELIRFSQSHDLPTLPRKMLNIEAVHADLYFIFDDIKKHRKCLTVSVLDQWLCRCSEKGARLEVVSMWICHSHKDVCLPTTAYTYNRLCASLGLVPTGPVVYQIIYRSVEYRGWNMMSIKQVFIIRITRWLQGGRIFIPGRSPTNQLLRISCTLLRG